MNKKYELDQEFPDSTEVRLDIQLDKRNIFIDLLDSRNHKCKFYFEDVVIFSMDYSSDDEVFLGGIEAIRFLEKKGTKSKYEIIFSFDTRLEIECRKFYYETEY